MPKHAAPQTLYRIVQADGYARTVMGSSTEDALVRHHDAVQVYANYDPCRSAKSVYIGPSVTVRDY